MAQIWRISANGKPVIQRCFKRLLKKKRWRKNNLFPFVKKNVIFAATNNHV